MKPTQDLPPLRLIWQDSELGRISEPEPGLLCLHLAAAAASTVEPRPVHGYCLGVVLRLHQAQILAQSAPLLGRIAALRLNGPMLASGWSLPLLQLDAALELRLELVQGGSLQVAATGLSLGFEGRAANFQESLAC